MTNLQSRIEAAEAGSRVALTESEVAELYGASWHNLAGRGDAKSKCDRFEIEPPKVRPGLTSGLPYLFGYRGDDCLLVTVCFTALKAQSEQHPQQEND